MIFWYNFIMILQGKEENITFGFNIDRGGTFTDFYVQEIQSNVVINEHVFKVLSQSAQGQGPIVGIKKFLTSKGYHQNQETISIQPIQYINLGTTIATNALLERKGCKNAMILTQGFGDLLQIRHQARPNIFDLSCERKPILATKTFQLNERIYLHNNDQPSLIQRQVQANDAKIFIKKFGKEDLEKIISDLQQQKIDSVGISLCNSYLSAQNELQVKAYLAEQGITNVQMGSHYNQLGYLKRSQTVNLDAFLNPIMKSYFKNIIQQFNHPEQLIFRVMKSDGGFDHYNNVKPSQLLLSGPAGGLIGCQSIIKQLQQISNQKINNLICIDMGGTSTDISRIQNTEIQTRYSFDIEGIEICTPHLEIDTIAAGGGSKLIFQNGMLVVGPESVGSNPGPVCYGIGDQLALTDANLILNRLNINFFPKIFGKNKNEELNKQKSRQSFEKLALQINQYGINKSIEEIAEGYIEIANELMAKSARKMLALGIPDALIIFGSAGGQHCCDLASKIGVNSIYIHKYSGILSAFGLSKAFQTKENKHFLGLTTSKQAFNYSDFLKLINSLKSPEVSTFTQIKYQIGIGYSGTSYTIKVPLNEALIETFESLHQRQNGFSLPTKSFRLEFFTELLIKKPEQFTIADILPERQKLQDFFIQRSQIFLNGRFEEVSVYNIQYMKNCEIIGPSLLLSSTSSILLKEGWKANIKNKIIHIQKQSTNKTLQNNLEYVQEKVDPIKLTLYSTRLMSIAEQMGKVLQKISISTNIRQRLDFSCGIFDWEGKLLANAPHLPVHLGSMETAVFEQIKRNIQVGDVVLSNHPVAGGSHLPDLTVISCAQISGTKMYLASRGHHADIGGTTPGSMPAFSRHIDQEGVAIQKFNLIEGNEFKQKQLRDLFKQSRRQDDNVSDLMAQMSANQMGIKLLQKLIHEYGINEFKTYVNYICENAAQSVRNLLQNFSIRNNLQQVDILEDTQFMDDGTPLHLMLTIDRLKRNAVFDFSGTGNEVLGNTNAPRSITRSAILYCLRSLIGEDIPLNSGCLVPITIIIPDNTILSPSKEAAVVGGNVQTSQKLVDLILKPFKHVACSQGTMNNFLFGTNTFCYYQTICGGTGAGQGFNGVTSQCHMTNTRITDIQSMESIYPVIVKQFKKREGSGGKGRYKGGEGVIRQIQFMEEVTVSILSQRRVFSSYGMEGGKNGLVGRNTYITSQGISKNLGGKNSFKLHKLQSVRIQTPGGGGFGPQPSK